MRRTFSQLRQSRFPNVIGQCQSNIPEIASVANECTQRLLNEFGEWGPWGGWAKVAFTASRSNPYITLGYQFARAINMDVCKFPLRIQNEFYEEIDAGIGLRGTVPCQNCCDVREAYDRADFPTMIDITPTNQLVRIYPTDPSDVGKSVMFLNALDQNGNGIYSSSLTGQINGFQLQLNTPFTTSSFITTGFGQVVKDITNGDVILTQVDATTGSEVTLSRYKPWETNPAYRRYYLGNIPLSCCGPQNTPPVVPQQVTITAMCKYEYIPIQNDNDFLLIGNIPALIEEAQALQYSSMDSPNAAAQEAKHHRKAVQLLQMELDHYLGKNLPATNFAPFGTARLEHQGIGLMI